MKTGRIIIKNLVSLTTAEIIARVVGFLTTAYLGRTLGAAGFGKLGFVQSFNSYFIIFAVLGLNTYGIREVAKHRDTVRTLVGQIFGLKVLTCVLSFVILMLLSIVVPRPDDVRWLMMLLAFSIFTNGLSLEWVFSGIEKMEWLAIIALFRNALYLILVFSIVHGANDLFLVGIAIIIPEVMSSVFFYSLYRLHYGHLSVSFETNPWQDLLRGSLPLVLTSFLIQIYYQLDIVMLGFWTTDMITGWYVSASTIILSLFGLGSLLGSILYPTLSRLLHESLERAQLLLRYTVRLVISFSLPITVGGMILAPKIITLIYGPGYEGAALAFRILILSIVVSFCSIPYTISLIANDERRYFVAATAAGAASNFVLNLWWIPRYQHIGAAIATVIAQIIVFIISFYYGRKIVRLKFAGFLLKPFLATAAMGCFSWYFEGQVLLNICMSACLYILIVAVLGGFELSDLKMIRSALLDKTS